MQGVFLESFILILIENYHQWAIIGVVSGGNTHAQGFITAALLDLYTFISTTFMT